MAQGMETTDEHQKRHIYKYWKRPKFFSFYLHSQNFVLVSMAVNMLHCVGVYILSLCSDCFNS